MCPDLQRQRGAALLILVALAGLGAATLLISAFGRNTLEAARERRTQYALAEAKDALVGYALAHGRLPRPAISGRDGRENPLPCTSEQSCTGIIAWVTLGIDGADGWSKLLRYSVTPEFTSTPLDASAAASKTVLGRASDGALHYLAGHPVCSRDVQCVPVVIFSHGKNNLGTSAAGVAQANASNTNGDEVQNDIATNNFMSRAASSDPGVAGGEYDDMVAWIELKTLFNRMNAARALR